MNKIYGYIEEGKFVRATPTREELPDGKGYIIRYLSDEDLSSGKYKEVVSSADFPSNADILERVGRIKIHYKDLGEYILRTYEVIGRRR